MSLTLEAVYEDGALRLARPLPLPNHAHVTVTIESDEEAVASLENASGGPTDAEPADAMEIVQRAIRRVRARQS